MHREYTTVCKRMNQKKKEIRHTHILTHNSVTLK